MARGLATLLAARGAKVGKNLTPVVGFFGLWPHLLLRIISGRRQCMNFVRFVVLVLIVGLIVTGIYFASL